MSTGLPQMGPEELGDLLWDLLRKRKDPRVQSMRADKSSAGFEVRTVEGRELIVTVESAEECTRRLPGEAADA